MGTYYFIPKSHANLLKTFVLYPLLYQVTHQLTLEHSQGNTYSKYVDWLETQLSSFCESQGCSVEEVFEKLKECMKGEQSEFMPTFMQNTEYTTFLEQMKHFANEKKIKIAASRAKAIAEDKKRRQSSTAACVNFSGHWIVDQEYKEIHRKTAEEYMEVAGCPWIYRKIFLHAAHSKYLNLYIDQKTDKEIRFVYRFKFFGGSDLTLKFGEENTYKNLWNETVKSTIHLDKKSKIMHGKGIKYPKRFPKGAKGWAEWKMGPYQETVVYSQHIELKSGEVITHEQHFVRADSDDGDKPSSK